MLKRRAFVVVLGLAAAICANAENALLSTTATGATAFGATSASLAGMAVDQADNRYLAIFLQNVRSEPRPILLPGFRRGIAVQKVSLAGDIIYTAWLAGIAEYGPPKLAVNAVGEVYLAGTTQSDYIIPTAGAIAQSVVGTRGFLLKLSAAGDRILIAAVLDGFSNATVASLTLDGNENIYLAVSTATLNATAGTFNSALSSEAPSFGNFVVKMNPTASKILLISRITEDSDTLSDFTVDADGNLFVAGVAGLTRTAPPYLRERVSRDGGATWSLPRESSLPDLNGRSGRVTFHPKDANIVFATGAGGIFRSTNRGITWAKIGAGLESYSTQRVFIHSATPNLMFATVNPIPDAPSVFRSDDSGASWSPVSWVRPIPQIVFDPSDPHYVFLDLGFTSFPPIRSTDGGHTFEYVSTIVNSPSGRLRGEGVAHLAVDPASPTTLYGFTRSGFARSDDHGTNWRTLYFLCGISPAAPVYVDPRSRSTLYATSVGGLVKSIDSGATWVLTSSQIDFDGFSLRRSESNPTVFFPNIQSRLMRTANAGAAWAPVNGLNERILPFALEVAPSDDSILYAAYQRNSDLFVTKLDADARRVLFTTVAGGFGAETLARIRVDAASRIYIAGNTNSLDFPINDPVPDGDTYDAFVIAFDPNADPAPIFSQRIGGVGRTTAGDMVADCSGNVVLAATSSTADLPATSDALRVRSAGGKDVLLVQFSPDGGVTLLSYFGGEKDEIAAALAMDLAGRIHLAGYTTSSAPPGLPQLQAEQTIFTSTFRTSLASCR